MAGHLQVLASLYRAAGKKQSDVAELMGYSSPSMISMVLSGKRGVGRKELVQMCEIAGITLTQLAGMSDDLKLTDTPEALEAASLIDNLPDDLRKDALDFIKGLSATAKHGGSIKQNK